jgi:hypothetical protein
LGYTTLDDQSVPTLKITIINDSKKIGDRGQFDLKKPFASIFVDSKMSF